MDKRLQFTPAQYKEKLTNYSLDTVDFESFNGLFKYKVNENDNPTVVEIMDDYFKIYTSVKPQISIVIIKPRLSQFRNMFSAKVYISENDVSMKVFWNRFEKVVYLIFSLFVIGTVVVGLANENFGTILFIPFYLISAISILIAKRRYRRFIINFMNSI